MCADIVAGQDLVLTVWCTSVMQHHMVVKGISSPVQPEHCCASPHLTLPRAIVCALCDQSDLQVISTVAT